VLFFILLIFNLDFIQDDTFRFLWDPSQFFGTNSEYHSFFRHSAALCATARALTYGNTDMFIRCENYQQDAHFIFLFVSIIISSTCFEQTSSSSGGYSCICSTKHFPCMYVCVCMYIHTLYILPSAQFWRYKVCL